MGTAGTTVALTIQPLPDGGGAFKGTVSRTSAKCATRTRPTTHVKGVPEGSAMPLVHTSARPAASPTVSCVGVTALRWYQRRWQERTMRTPRTHGWTSTANRTMNGGKARSTLARRVATWARCRTALGSPRAKKAMEPISRATRVQVEALRSRGRVALFPSMSSTHSEGSSAPLRCRKKPQWPGWRKCYRSAM